MSVEGCDHDRILILGIGNTLLGDDGFGVHVTERLRDGFRCSLKLKTPTA